MGLILSIGRCLVMFLVWADCFVFVFVNVCMFGFRGAGSLRFG